MFDVWAQMFLRSRVVEPHGSIKHNKKQRTVVWPPASARGDDAGAVCRHKETHDATASQLLVNRAKLSVWGQGTPVVPNGCAIPISTSGAALPFSDRNDLRTTHCTRAICGPEFAQEGGRDRPMLTILGDDGDRLAVVLGDDTEQGPAPIGLKTHPLAQTELQHRRVGPHVAQELQSRHNPVVEVDEFLFGELVYVDHSRPRGSGQLGLLGWSVPFQPAPMETPLRRQARQVGLTDSWREDWDAVDLN